MMHGRTSRQVQKTSGLKSRLPSKARPQGSNEAGTLNVAAWRLSRFGWKPACALNADRSGHYPPERWRGLPPIVPGA
jgi:hypothetical protein